MGLSRRFSNTLVLCMCLGLPGGAGATPEKGVFHPSEFSFTVHEEKINARIDDVPLHDVLLEIARRFNFHLHFFERKNPEVISVQLAGVTLEKALGKLLVGKDYAIVKARSGRTGNAQGSRLIRLFVLPRDTENQSQHQVNLTPQVEVESEKPITSLEDLRESSNETEIAKFQKIADDHLVSEDPSQREAAVELLGYLNSPEAEHQLNQALRHDLDEGVRAMAAEALGDRWDPQHLGVLSDALFNDPADFVRSSAAEAMGEIGNAEAIPALQKALLDSSPVVRESAVEALAYIGDQQIIPLLHGALSDPDPEVRRSAALELDSLGEMSPQ